MASPSPPAILPITTTTITTTPSSLSQPAPVSTPAFRALFTHITTTIRTGLSHSRPWYELIDRSAFSKPDSISDATFRIRKNFAYFKTNYLSIITLVLAFSLLTNPLSLLLLLSLLAAWIFLYLFRSGSDPPLVLFGRTFSDRETLAGLTLFSIIVVFMTSVGSVLISALMVGVGVVCAHGAFRVPEDLFLDEQETSNASSGFLSFITSAASNAAVAAAPVVSGRV